MGLDFFYKQNNFIQNFRSELGNVDIAEAYLSLPIAEFNFARYRDIQRNEIYMFVYVFKWNRKSRGYNSEKLFLVI